MEITIHRWCVRGFACLMVIFFASAVQDTVWNHDKPISRVPTTQKVVALTVDDGPHYKTTPVLLQILRKKKVHVTFFVLGSNAALHPEILAQAVADGHEIANHAYSHVILTKMSRNQYEEEMDKAEKAIVAVAPKPRLFRPPGGAYNDGILEAARARGYTTVLWSIDPRDWRRPSVDAVVKTVMDQVKPGSIILLHDGQYPLPTPQAVSIIIDRLREQGYTLVTVSELLSHYEESR
ncbi:polysaccharide deacetylase [Lucifera butyrica]|uniref:Polysaccharide deacetylase n=1 Tax=Lucifera butyrica TaxID=1351585 RepID=A0A498R2E8_9FIRM|nr:polysaccharide deacetylase family protein [Lucifera butyrica]VBB05325.1 polysaccharide deacetylase [Lucifera butyrica]